MGTAGEGEGGTVGRVDWYIYTTLCETRSSWEAAVSHQALSSALCDDLEAWKEG